MVHRSCRLLQFNVWEPFICQWDSLRGCVHVNFMVWTYNFFYCQTWGELLGKDSVSTVVDKLWKRIVIIYFFIWILSFNYCGLSCSPNLFACRSDEHVASPNNFQTFSSRQITRILNLMKKKLSWSNTKFLLLIYKKMCGSYRGDIGSLMLATYTVALIRSFFQCCPCQ